MDGEDDDLRGDLLAAMDGEGGAPEGGAPEGEAIAPLQPDSGQPAADGTSVRSARDSLGRFLPKAGAESGQAAPPLLADSTPVPRPNQPAQESGAAPSDIQPPASLSPTAREHWATTPPAIREYITQREQQMQAWANQTGPLRNTGQAFMQAVEPFRMTIQAEGVDPITAVRNLMQVGTTLRFGTPIEKARMVADVVKAYGVGIEDLDAALTGALPAQAANQGINVQAEVQRALAPLMNMAQQRQQQEVQQAENQVRSELQQFSQGKEFIGDVRGVMADLIEVANRNGNDLSLQDAYDRACALHPEVSKVIMARRQGASAQQLTAAAQRAKGAAVSVRGVAPVGNPSGAEPSSIRESIEAAFEAHSRV
jgi:hypothetical protein